MTTTTLEYRLGEPDWERRYPVLIGESTVIGAVFRWHRDWLTLTSQGERNLGRPEKGRRGVPQAAAQAAAEYEAGHITPVSLADVTAAVPTLDGPVPLLHPRMPETPRNVDAATKVMAALKLHRWTPYTGFPGSENPWWQECQLCGWQGPRYWSHQRGRNGEPPSTHRHTGGCIGDEKVRELIPVYRQSAILRQAEQYPANQTGLAAAERDLYLARLQLRTEQGKAAQRALYDRQAKLRHRIAEILAVVNGSYADLPVPPTFTYSQVPEEQPGSTRCCIECGNSEVGLLEIVHAASGVSTAVCLVHDDWRVRQMLSSHANAS